MKTISYVLLLSLIIALAACSTSREMPDANVAASPSQTYTSSFPAKDTSGELQKIRQSLTRITSTANYITYFFDRISVTPDKLKTMDLEKAASRTMTSSESMAGTAISILENQQHLAFLTNAHVVDFPDTLISYYSGEDIEADTYVKAVTIKRTQNNLILDIGTVGSFEVLALDSQTDIALLHVRKENHPEIEVSPLPITVGDPRDLRWGSFIYVMGFPKGFPMVTRGMVSDPNRSPDGDFLTDALFNSGISGGIIMASRDNFNSLEWVGMTNTAAADFEKMLVPDPDKSYNYPSFDLYTDSVYIRRESRIAYGITQALPVTKVHDFVRANSQILSRLGLTGGTFRIR